MKKAIAIIGITCFAITMFVNSNNSISTEGFDLSSLVSLNSADAECDYTGGVKSGWCDAYWRCGPLPLWAECIN